MGKTVSLKPVRGEIQKQSELISHKPIIIMLRVILTGHSMFVCLYESSEEVEERAQQQQQQQQQQLQQHQWQQQQQDVVAEDEVQDEPREDEDEDEALEVHRGE